MSVVNNQHNCPDFPDKCRAGRACWIGCRFITVEPNCEVEDDCAADCPQWASYTLGALMGWDHE